MQMKGGNRKTRTNTIWTQDGYTYCLHLCSPLEAHEPTYNVCQWQIFHNHFDK